ncbi:MAG: phosphoenolpyruvate--protein phosphotransferase [Pyrinomonadaceae bacterium]|nr:phosphoenolpyruvate--protein phosphotransferase [Pyrinomonadaceae bacterium]
MSAFEDKKTSHVSKNNGSELRLKARSVSRGVAIGNVVSLYGRKRQFYKILLEDSQIDREISRFKASIRLAKRQLLQISSKKIETAKETQANIFEAHLLILEDKSFLEKIETVIKQQKVNAEWSVKSVTENYITKYKTIADEYLRERYIDLEDVSERILTALGGGGKSTIRLKKDSIIVAKEVRPSTLIELIECHPKAIVAENGGWTSHTFILAREMNLPAVTGTAGILRSVQTGDEVIVDGYNGQVILHPAAETVRQYKLAAAQFQQIDSTAVKAEKGIIKTLDGREIIIRSNLDLPDGYRQAKRFGAKGIGLYRSEYLFNQYKGFPSENEQIKVYRKIAGLVGEEGVRIRTFDLSAEQFAEGNKEKEKNPALGMRAIRLSLSHKKQFRAQLRAILQASYKNKIDVILPMISDVSEIMQTRKILKSEKENLIKKGVDVGNPRIGAMIEVPSAVFTIDEIAAEVDFLCLGTNDLVQYLLAVDRDNETVSEWFQTLHPAVLRAIRIVLEAAENRGIPVIICGEMAGSPFYAPILIGLGAKELSMNVNSMLRVRKVITGIAFEEARELVKRIKNCRTAREIETFVHQNIRDKWAHLFPAELYSPKNYPNFK